jgi:glutamate/tyrosine decarboxylase-like PLP-dependent enzyme
MYLQLESDLNHFASLLETVKQQGIDYLGKLSSRPTSVKQESQIPGSLNEIGIGALETLQLFNEKYEKQMVGSAGPRYLGFVTGGVTPAALMGDWLTSVYDQNPQSSIGPGDISAMIEMETVSLLLDLFDLPKNFMGGFVSGATMSNFTCLAVARQWLGKQLGKDFAKNGVEGKITVLTGVPHSSSVKSLSMLGIGSNNFIKLQLIGGNRESLDTDDLETKIKELHGQPFILISSGGTVNTVDFDDMQAIAKLKGKYDFWWHIDAAFGAFAACSPNYKHLLQGWQQADSITVDCHKWLNVPYENAVFFVKEKHRILQLNTFQNTNAPYLGNPSDHFNFINFLPENSRRLKALPVWFTLKAYGANGYRYIVENAIALAGYFGSFIAQSDAFELLAPVRLNNVCFTLKGEKKQDKVDGFLTALNKTGIVFMTPTVYHNKKGIRAAFVNWCTKMEDVDMIINELKKLAPPNKS